LKGSEDDCLKNKKKTPGLLKPYAVQLLKLGLIKKLRDSKGANSLSQYNNALYPLHP
jgi:hypothetical protein